MDVPVLLLANAASVANDLLDVSGGGWELYSCPSMPWGVTGALCGIVEITPEERGEPLELRFSVSDESGHDLDVSASILVSAPPGQGPARAPFAWPFAVVVREPLVARFDVRAESGALLASVSLPVEQVADAGA